MQWQFSEGGEKRGTLRIHGELSLLTKAISWFAWMQLCSSILGQSSLRTNSPMQNGGRSTEIASRSRNLAHVSKLLSPGEAYHVVWRYLSLVLYTQRSSGPYKLVPCYELVRISHPFFIN